MRVAHPCVKLILNNLMLNTESLEKVLDELARKRHTKVEILVLHGFVSRQPLPNLERSRNWEVRLLEKEIKQHALSARSEGQSERFFFFL